MQIPKKEILYEYDDTMEETYMQYLIKSFKKTLSDNLYDLVIVDCNNNSLRTLNEFYCNAKDSNFVVSRRITLSLPFISLYLYLSRFHGSRT